MVNNTTIRQFLPFNDSTLPTIQLFQLFKLSNYLALDLPPIIHTILHGLWAVSSVLVRASA